MATGGSESPETRSDETATADAGLASDLDQSGSLGNGYSTQAEPALAENPEIVVGAAFVGGFLLARILRRLGS